MQTEPDATTIGKVAADQRTPNSLSSRNSSDEQIQKEDNSSEAEVVSLMNRRSKKSQTRAELSFDQKLRIACIATFSALGSMLFGLDIGYIGPIIECASFKEDIVHVNATDHVDSKIEGMVVSLFSIGAMCSANPLVSAYFLDNWGRKISIMVGAVVFIIGSALQGAASGTFHFLIGRFVAGAAVGLLSSVVVLYQSELAPPSMRGALSALYQLGITFGILVAAFVDQNLVESKDGWRLVMGIICIPAVLLCCGMVFLPRSPRWLVQQGRRAEALKVLVKIRTAEQALEEEHAIYEEVQRAKADGAPAWSDLLKGRIARLLLLGITLQFLQQMVGMNAFMYFGPKIFESIGFSKNLFTTITNFVNFLSTFPAVMMADTSGRRCLMLWSAIGMSASCMVMGITGLFAFHLPDQPSKELLPPSDPIAGWVIAGSAFFFVFNFAYGFGPIVWVYCSEIFPLKHRTRCIGVCTLANWAGNFLIAQFTPVLLDSIQFLTFFVFCFFCVLSALISSWLPETKGVPLEKIQCLFDNKAGFKSTSEEIKSKKLDK